MTPPVVVAEVGCNHQGSLELAIRHIHEAAKAGASYVKFQKRDNGAHLLRNPDWNKPHPNPTQAFGPTYYEHRKALEFDGDTHQRLMDECTRAGIRYACSVWDMASAEWIADLKPDYIKVPSASNGNMELIAYLLREFRGEIHVSLGMTTNEERQELIGIAKLHAGRIRLYHCTSGYPVPFGQLDIDEIPSLAVGGLEPGYSGHHVGIAIDIAAYSKGATWIERHFTLDRTLKGTDQALSLEPPELSQLVFDLKRVHAAATKRMGIASVEKAQREKLRWT